VCVCVCVHPHAHTTYVRTCMCTCLIEEKYSDPYRDLFIVHTYILLILPRVCVSVCMHVCVYCAEPNAYFYCVFGSSRVCVFIRCVCVTDADRGKSMHVFMHVCTRVYI